MTGQEKAPWLCHDCEALIAEAIQWRDWQSLNLGVYCDKHDPRPSSPENVDSPRVSQ